MAELIYHLGREMPTVGGSVDPAEFNHDTGILDGKSPYLIPALDYLSLSAMETDGGNVTVKIGKDGHDVKAIQVKLRSAALGIERFTNPDPCFVESSHYGRTFIADLGEWSVSDPAYFSSVEVASGYVTFRATNSYMPITVANLSFNGSAAFFSRVKRVGVEYIVTSSWGGGRIILTGDGWQSEASIPIGAGMVWVDALNDSVVTGFEVAVSCQSRKRVSIYSVTFLG